jgi:dienelactone hydrolase
VTREWSIPGADGQPIIGDEDVPDGEPRGVIVIAHGFKGYKDYGMFPRIARECALRGNLIAHRFNFSHSGMTRDIARFERPDLFERDTWTRQVFDLTYVLRAIARGDLAGANLPLFVLGHSRGGVTTILTAARLTYPAHHRESPANSLAGLITLAAPASCNPFTSEEQRQLLAQGWLESPSSRTGQRLRVGRAFVQEQLDDPALHDVLAHAARIACPIMVIHGRDDPTVPMHSAEEIVAAARDRATLRIIDGGDHVFNTANPLPDDAPASPQLQEVIDAIITFTGRLMAARSP